MPIVTSQFDPHAFLRNGHGQTILPVLLPRRLDIVYERERLELADGDFLDLDWARAGGGRLAILSHGLEGCSGNDYIRGMAESLNAAGWDALAWNFRSCSGELNRLPRFYHSGETGDIAAVIAHAAAFYKSIALVGFSLGGNVTLKYLGEAPPHPAIVGAVAISVPIDLAASAHALDKHAHTRIYVRRFLKTIVAKVEAKSRLFPGQFDTTGIRSIRTFLEFDDRFTAPLHGFRDAADYWAQSSARQFIPRIRVPTLLLNAKDDPFLTPECFPFDEAREHPCFFLEAPDSGGHVGFLDFAKGSQPWSERRAVEFLDAKT
jgi:predicted alpha/beta-fold hydrolase